MNYLPSTRVRQSFPKNSTPVPNYLIDQVMPNLKDTEWRVLIVIVRQTIGWIHPESGGRKGSDWLTHRQLKQRTGRASEAICQAIDSLVQKRLIEVADTNGARLNTSQARRRQRGKVFFRLSALIATPPCGQRCG